MPQPGRRYRWPRPRRILSGQFALRSSEFLDQFFTILADGQYDNNPTLSDIFRKGVLARKALGRISRFGVIARSRPFTVNQQQKRNSTYEISSAQRHLFHDTVHLRIRFCRYKTAAYRDFAAVAGTFPSRQRNRIGT